MRSFLSVDWKKLDWKRIGRSVMRPPTWVFLLLDVISAVLLTFVFLEGMEEHPIAYVVYIIAFYSLTVTCVFCGFVLPGKYKDAKNKVYSTKLGNRYFTDAVYRTQVSLYGSLGINLLYVAVNLFSGYLYRTIWFYILAGYYGILAVMRFLLVKYVRGNEIGENLTGEWKRARVCACILTLVNMSLSGVILMMMYQDKGFVYHGMLIYIMAMYTFYITIKAIINIVKYRKYKSPVMTITKIITLASALVSMLSLETAMFAAFGTEMTMENKRIMIAATGAGIAITVIAMSGYMIVRSTKEIEGDRGT